MTPPQPPDRPLDTAGYGVNVDQFTAAEIEQAILDALDDDNPQAADHLQRLLDETRR